MQITTWMLLQMTEVYTIFAYKIICAANLFSHMKYLQRGRDTPSTRLPEHRRCLTTAHFLKVTVNFFPLSPQPVTTPQQPKKPQLPFQSGNWPSVRVETEEPAEFNPWVQPEKLSRGRWLRGWSCLQHVWTPALLQTSPKIKQWADGMCVCVWQHVHAEKTGSLTCSCLLCLH